MLHDCRGHRLTGATRRACPITRRRCASSISTSTIRSRASTRPSPHRPTSSWRMRCAPGCICSAPSPPAFRSRARRWRQRETLPATAQEQGHLAAIEHLVAGRWHAASQALEDVAAEHPRDLLALQAGHLLDFFRGDCRMLRDRIARALPAWSPDVPGYHAVLGMHAFGLEETGDYAAAEKTGRDAVERERRDSWAQHAVAHVMEMQGRQQDGIAWMRDNTDGWSQRQLLRGPQLVARRALSSRSRRYRRGARRCSTGRSTARARA